MIKNKKQRIAFLFGLLLAFIGGILLFSFSGTVLAQANVENGDVFGTASIDQNVALGNRSPIYTAVRIINVGLGLLGIIAVGIVLYGGFVYMTSGGNEEKIATARKILVNGVIGLAIILSSWAITRFVLQKLGEATGVKGLAADEVPGQCADAEFANNNPDICFGDNIPGGENRDCAVKNNKVLLVRGITPSIPTNDAVGTGMNNVKIRVLFNNALNGNDPKSIFTVVRIQGGQSTDVTGSFEYRMLNDDPAAVEATYKNQNGVDQLPQGEYAIQVNKNLKGADNQELVEKVDCGEFPSQARFSVNTDGIIDNERPAVGPVMLDGKVAGVDGEDLTRGRSHTLTLSTTDNSGIGIVHFHVSVVRKGQQVSNFEYYDIPKISRGSKAPAGNPFVARFPLMIAANTELFDEYTVTIDTFDIDGNSTPSVFKGIIVGKDCGVNKEGPECLNNNQACNNDLQCASKKCVNNQCVVWPVITDIKKFWDGAAGNYITIQGNYFGERVGHVYFGYQKQGGAAGEMIWQEAFAPACEAQDVWHDEEIIVAVPDDALLPLGTQAIIKVVKAPEIGQEGDFADTTIDNHGPIAGPNRGYFIKNNVKRPGLCAVGVAAGNPNIPGGSNTAPQNTDLLALGTAFGAREQGKIMFGEVQGEVAGWSDTSIRTKVPQNIQSGRVDVSVDQNGISSNEVSFYVGDSAQAQGKPIISSIDPVSVTRRSYITIAGENFGDAVGAVYLAPNATVKCRENGRFNNELCKQLDTETCGNGWSKNQIFAQIPPEIDLKQYTVIVERGKDFVTSEGNNTITVAEGAPTPSICFFSPQSGPAPLAEGSSGLIFKGVNFSDAPKIYFSWRGSVASDVNTWLVSEGENVHKDARNSNGVFTTVTSSIPVVNGVSLTPNLPAAIRLKNAEGKISNQVFYTVNDCKNSAPIPGFQCCVDGPDKGFFKPNNQICKGQSREGGYAWRFTTGRIPEAPQVLERCVANPVEGQPPVFPSPAPWVGWLGKQEACINQSVVVRITLPANAELRNINQNTVKVFTCEDKSGQPDCSGAKKTAVALERGDLEVSGNGYITILNNPFFGDSRLDPNTWYHVELSKDIESTRKVSVGGIMIDETEQLLSTRSCGGNTAYCFDFKTGTNSNRCELDTVGVLPNPYTVNYLGVLQTPASFDAEHPFDPSPSSTLYYKVWGSGNQNCSVINVQGYGWNWNTSNASKATAARTIANDARATVTALANTVPETVAIRASSSTLQGEKVGSADLTIDLSDPKVIDFWPSCTESCTQAELGVRFDRQMFMDSFDGNIRLYKCADELCNAEADVLVHTSVTDKNYTTYRFEPNTLVDGKNIRQLEKSTWYKVVVTTDVKALGSFGVDVNSPDRPGKNLKNEFSWRFRTTAQDDGKCIAERVIVEPQSFVARQIGEKTKYNSFPRTAPNKCSKLGQTLNPWLYGWSWNVGDQTVATVTQFENKGDLKSFCGIDCLPLGSDISSDRSAGYPLCGNGTVDPGEDCDIGLAVEVAGKSCTLHCLRPGNTNTSDVAQPICGDGRVSPEAGEECDPKNPTNGAYCSTSCTWKGSSSEPSATTSTPWCGSGSKTLGEDCDIANLSTTTPDGVFGCSKQCLHLGTSVSQDWCTVNRNVTVDGQKAVDTVECKQALSICGNGALELGEECEYFQEGNEAGVYVLLNAETGEKVRAVTASKNVCTNRCLLQNICDINQIPLQGQQDKPGPRCVKGTEGCTNGCRVSGASVGYSTPAFCGDGVVQTGEHPMCENKDLPEQNLGQNPVQIVTAVGLGKVNPKNQSQETKITAGVSKVTGTNGQPQESSARPVGSGDYALQCGYTEKVEVTPNLLQNLNGNFENETSGWLIEVPSPAFRDSTQMNATRDKAPEGQVALHVVGDAYVYHSNVVVEPNTSYILSFDYKITQGTIFAYTYNRAPHIPVDLGPLLNNLNGIRVSGPNRDWVKYTRSIVTPADVTSFGISLDISSSDNVNPADVLIDNVRLSPVVHVDSTNDCPGAVGDSNSDNRFGVASNSCCYVRPTRVESYPANNSENVCLNTALSISYDSFIDEKSLSSNIVLVSGHGENYRCGADEILMSEQVKNILAVNPDALEKVGIWQKMWGGIKHLFASLFGVGEASAVREDLVTWCGSTNVKTQVAYETSNDLKDVTTTVSVYLEKALLPNTQYGILLSGGNGGIKDINGVGVRNPVKVHNVYNQTDFIEFQTGDKLCKIDHLEVYPDHGLFTTPNSTSTFQSKILSTNSQRLQSIPAVYAWEMGWVPADNALFSIPAAGTPGNENSVIIAAKNVEGTVTAAALAHVTVDVTPGNNQQGMVFSAPFNLQASFCENPWPPRPYFPYEEGISFGSKKNQDGVNAAKKFDGSELFGVRVGGGLLGGGSDSYFNLSFSYCADANLSGNTDDDLPYLKPLVFGDMVKGQCKVIGGNIPGLPRLPGLPAAPQYCTSDIQCQSTNLLASCLNKTVMEDSTLGPGVLKKTLFVNDKNDDAIGLQISQNSKRLSAREWYMDQFPGADGNILKDIKIDGYDAVTDGKSYYVNALNQDGGPTAPVYNNIYIFSINGNAQADTQKVFTKLMTSVKFNINISDFGYCLSSQPGVSNNHQSLEDNFSRLNQITSHSCQSDFDCRSSSGLPIEGTNGVCSNAKTKMLRDWQRLQNIQAIQERLETYKNSAAGSGKYPQMESGSFVPGYTNSRWNQSWSTLGNKVGGLPVDPLNQWTSCGDNDPQTCWDSKTSSVQCPYLSSVLEYDATEDDDAYLLRSPLEYFHATDPVNPVVKDFILDQNKFSTDPWCVPGEVIAASAGQCGNGIVNIGSDEECDPPGSVERTNMGLVGGKPGSCVITGNQCQKSAEDCGYIASFQEFGIPADKNPASALMEGSTFCASSRDASTVIINTAGLIRKNNVDYYPVFSCTADADCQSIATYKNAGQLSFVQDDKRTAQPFAQFEQFFNAAPQNMRCVSLNVVNGIFVSSKAVPQQCQGAVPAAGVAGECPVGQDAARVCTDQCKFSYGSCQAQGICGNGRVESGEVCDDGVLNGTYGHCSDGRTPSTGQANQPVKACQGIRGDYCGNGLREGNNEFCEYLPDLTLPYHPAAPAESPARISLASFLAVKDQDVALTCSDVNVNACTAYINNLKNLITAKPEIFNKRCSLDKSILCSQDSDCQNLPSADTTIDLLRDGDDSNKLLQPAIAAHSNYGICVDAPLYSLGTNYSQLKNLSCAASCQAVGKYCGDGEVTGPYEQCDDKNNVDGDGCSKYCRTENAQVVSADEPAAAPLSCGNGVVDAGESCDLGDQNGKACVPQYGRSCTYCSGDCRNVLTVDPQSFCGNNILEQPAEKCDTIDGVVTAATTTIPGTKSVALSCPTNQKGAYSCGQCNQVSNNCTLCGERTQIQGGVPPRVSFLLPLTNQDVEKRKWANENRFGFYVKRKTLGNSTVIRSFSVDGNNNQNIQFYLAELYQGRIPLGTANIFEAGIGVNADNLCVNEYNIAFNREKLDQVDSNDANCDGFNCFQGVNDIGKYIMNGQEDLFSFSLANKSNSIDDELVVSPAVPRNTLRVVVKWKNSGNVLSNYDFHGVIHNSAFENSTFSDVDIVNPLLSNRVRFDNATQYWLPDGSLLEESVYVHPVISLGGTSIQSMTLNLTGGDNIPDARKRSYAFMVEALNAGGLVPVGSLTNQDVTVEVYSHHDDQNPQYSIYKPSQVFTLSFAGGSNPQARYWHVFNINWDSRTRTYRLEVPRLSGGAAFNQGKLALDMPDVLCYVPREECNREVSP